MWTSGVDQIDARIDRRLRAGEIGARRGARDASTGPGVLFAYRISYALARG